MAVPRNRHSNARKNSKRSHHAKKPKQLSVCSNCRGNKPSHVMCPHCGWYAGRVVLSAKGE